MGNEVHEGSAREAVAEFWERKVRPDWEPPLKGVTACLCVQGGNSSARIAAGGRIPTGVDRDTWPPV